jgi:hypothetical protein
MLFLTGGMLYGQSGSRFPEFAKKMEYYFDKELITDLEKALPQGVNYTIWGWDVGDFSGDGHYDVAFVVRMASERKRIVQTYLFVDMDGFLTQVAKFPYKFIETPLEVGIIIKSNACLITQKHKQFNWSILGYRFLDGNLVRYDDYKTERIGKFTKETYCNYQNLKSSLKYVLTSKKQVEFFTKYTTLPAYPRGKIIYKGYADEAHISDIDFVNRGAWYWTGMQDASYDIKTVYDDEYIYISMNIHDDNFVPQHCDTCIGDYVRLWFDFSNVNSKASRFPEVKRKKLIYRNIDNEEIFSITIYPGDFYDKRAYVSKVSSTENLEDYQKATVNNIRTASAPRNDGYVIKVKIPFRLFGYEVAPVDNESFASIGFTSVFHDIDNEFRPEEETQIAMSNFNPSKPVTYGEILLIPQDKWYGSAKNYYRLDILRFLLELGF